MSFWADPPKGGGVGFGGEGVVVLEENSWAIAELEGDGGGVAMFGEQVSGGGVPQHVLGPLSEAHGGAERAEEPALGGGWEWELGAQPPGRA